MNRPGSIVLVARKQEGHDAHRNPVYTESRRTIFANVQSVRMSEFYQAAAQSLKPEIVFEIYDREYQNEQLVEYAGKKYSVIRTYTRTLDRIELICERKIGNES